MAYIIPAEGPPMLRESIFRSMGRSRPRLTVSSTTPTIGAPSTSGWAIRVMSTLSGSPARVPLRLIVSPIWKVRMIAPASSAVITGRPSMCVMMSPTCSTPSAGVSSATWSTEAPSPVKPTS